MQILTTLGNLNLTTHSDQFKTVGKPAVFLFCKFLLMCKKINKSSGIMCNRIIIFEKRVLY